MDRNEDQNDKIRRKNPPSHLDFQVPNARLRCVFGTILVQILSEDEPSYGFLRLPQPKALVPFLSTPQLCLVVKIRHNMRGLTKTYKLIILVIKDFIRVLFLERFSWLDAGLRNLKTKGFYFTRIG